MRHLLPVVLLALPSNRTAAQEPTAPLLSACRTDQELEAFAARLGTLRAQLEDEPQAAREACAAIGADAARALATCEPLGRVLAVRALGLAARTGDDSVEAWQALARACRDEARMVRAEAVRQICRAKPPAAKLARQAQAALAAIDELDRGDEEMLRLARSGRESLQALLHRQKANEAGPDGAAAPAVPPAAPGGAAVGGLGGPRLNANESAAIATLKCISSSQAQMQACGALDTDRDGIGEYAFFRELSGVANLRGDEKGGLTDQRLSPPVLSASFGRVEQGVVLRSGYCFAMFLPGQGGRWLGEGDAPDSPRCVVANEAEKRWCVYAWPMEWGRSGKRAFFIDHHGDVLVTFNTATRYEGLQQRPDPEAAVSPKPESKWPNALGRDGSFWMVIG